MIKHFAVLALSLFFASAPPGLAKDALAVIPLRATGIESESAETAYYLLRNEIAKSGEYDVVSASKITQALSLSECADLDCAREAGASLGASKVVFGSLNKLGNKIIVEFNLADVNTGSIILADNITAKTIEDLEIVMKRAARSIVNEETIESGAEVGLITENETQESRRRKTVASFGSGFGYIFPTSNCGGDCDRIFAFDFKALFDVDDYGISLLAGIREGIALNIGGSYFLSKSSLAPYLGAGLGFRWIITSETVNPFGEAVRGDGPELLFSAGILALRTFDFNVFLNADYAMTFNENNDRGVILTIGFLRKGKFLF